MTEVLNKRTVRTRGFNEMEQKIILSAYTELKVPVAQIARFLGSQRKTVRDFLYNQGVYDEKRNLKDILTMDSYTKKSTGEIVFCTLSYRGVSATVRKS